LSTSFFELHIHHRIRAERRTKLVYAGVVGQLVWRMRGMQRSLLEDWNGIGTWRTVQLVEPVQIAEEVEKQPWRRRSGSYGLCRY
jgi:hypothetical protein